MSSYNIEVKPELSPLHQELNRRWVNNENSCYFLERDRPFLSPEIWPTKSCNTIVFVSFGKHIYFQLETTCAIVLSEIYSDFLYFNRYGELNILPECANENVVSVYV
jgi:hypothetical protein